MNAEANPPIPDPTVLTTEQLLREIANLKDWMRTLADGQQAVFDERFKSVETQFVLVERQRVEQKQDTEKAVQAALSAAKEAVREQTAASDRAITKTETATGDLLKQISTTFTTDVSAVRASVADVTLRVGKIENLKQGASEQRTTQTENRTGLYALVGCIGAVLLIVTVSMNLLTRA